MVASDDPRTGRPAGVPAQQQPSQPGLTDPMDPAPDHGEDAWVGRSRLVGRRALITGDDSGIGRAVALAFAREGADLAIMHLPEEHDDAAETVRLVEEGGRRCTPLVADVRDEGQAVDAVARSVEALGGLDAVILNAGHQLRRDGIESLTVEEIRRVVDTNIVGHLVVAREAVPHLSPGSSIITTTSIQAAGPKPALLDYAMTKAAQVAFTEALADELGDRGIRVNAVAPGPIWTPLIPATGFDDEAVEQFGRDTPLGRPGQPAELAGAYVYLASDEASYTSGAVVPVTGGKGF